MIVENTSLGFSNGDPGCDCRNSDYCQLVVHEDNPVWQIVADCDEITRGEEKLPCENSIVSEYFSDFPTYDPQYVNVSQNEITWKGTQPTAEDVISIANYLAVGKTYLIRFTIVNRTKGTLTVAGNTYDANGNYSINYTATDDQLTFTGSGGENAFDGTVINISIICIRYSQLYTATHADGDYPFTYTGQTSICKSGVAGVLTLNDFSRFHAGQTYKICFTLTNVSAGQVLVVLGETTSDPYIQSGRFCVDLVYSVGASDGKLKFVFDAAFDGCISDITTELIPEFRIALFDAEGNEIPDSLDVESIGNTIKVKLEDTVPEGCYNIGIADSCSNFKNQFFGNAITDPRVERYSTNINTSSGAFTSEGNTVGDTSTNTIKFIDALCCDKEYNIGIKIADTSLLNDFATFEVQLNLGGNIYMQPVTPPVPDTNFTVIFNAVVAGCENTDAEVRLVYTVTNPAFFMTGEFVFAGSYITMTGAQLCPEFYSTCLQVLNQAPCDSMLIKYRNDNDAFGFDYHSVGYREADGFYNQLRIIAKLWKAKYPRSREVQKNSTGLRTTYYSDVDKKYSLTTEPLPEYIHDALNIAIDHRTLIIEDAEFVSNAESYDPEWNKSSTLAPVEIELFKQRDRALNTLC